MRNLFNFKSVIFRFYYEMTGLKGEEGRLWKIDQPPNFFALGKKKKLRKFNLA